MADVYLDTYVEHSIEPLQVLVVVLLTAAAATNKSPQPEHPGQTEFGACSDLAILNLIWLGRVLFVVYLLFWARWIKRVLTYVNPECSPCKLLH